jgi:hypothetical protein
MGDSEGSAPAFQGSSLDSNPDISKKYKMGDKNKEVTNILQIIQKKIFYLKQKRYLVLLQ